MYSKHKKVLLQNIDIKHLKCSYTKGYRGRCISLARLLNECFEILDIEQSTISLLVLRKKDWQSLSSYRYGIVNLKISKNSKAILVPAKYSPQLLHNFDDLILEAKKNGFEASGQIHEFLDALVLVEYLRALVSSEYQKQDLELEATRLFWYCLKQLELDNLAKRCNEWSEVFATEFQEKLLKTNRNSLSIKNQLARQSYYLLAAKSTRP